MDRGAIVRQHYVLIVDKGVLKTALLCSLLLSREHIFLRCKGLLRVLVDRTTGKLTG
jgi:hypothetical protein